MPSRPTQRDVEAGELLRQAREASRYTQKDVGELVGKSQSWAHRIEAGKQQASTNELRRLIDLYQPDETLLGKLEQVLTPMDAGETLEVSQNAAFIEMIKLAPQASKIMLLQSERIAMELQTDEYTVMQYKVAGKKVSREDLLLEKRQREVVLAGNNPPRYSAILAQSSLERMPGGNSSLIRQQASHLLNLLEERPRFSLQILPTLADLAYLDCDMTILKFASKRQSMVYVPYGLDGCLLKGRWQVREREYYWATVQRAALSKADSRKFLDELAS